MKKILSIAFAALLATSSFAQKSENAAGAQPISKNSSYGMDDMEPL